MRTLWLVAVLILGGPGGAAGANREVRPASFSPLIATDPDAALADLLDALG